MSNSGYQLEGNAAQLYEQDIVPTMSKPLTNMMFEHMPLEDGNRVLDVACGTGIIARVVADRFHRIASIIGVDLNPGMLDVARKSTPKTAITIAWQQGDACALPFPDHRFDVVLCQQGLQFIPDKLTALREMKRVLVPRGRLAVSVWSEPPLYQAALAEALQQHVSAAAAASCRAPYALSDGEALRQLLEAAGFHTIQIRQLVLRRRFPVSALDFAARQPYARHVAAASEEARVAIAKAVSTAVQSYRDGDAVIMPQASHLVLASA